MNLLLSVHVAAGGLAMVLGYIALFTRKGGMTHRRSGLLFVYAMLIMGFSASILGSLKSPPENVRVGLLTAYFVVTALTTVRTVTPLTRRINIAALMVVLTLAAFSTVGAVKIFNLPGRSYNGIPFFVPLIIATALALAGAGDIRVLRSGVPRGGARLARHLWRMCFALFIAAASFFSIRERVARVLPEPFTNGWMRALPILLLFGAMVYWLVKVRGLPRLPNLSRTLHNKASDGYQEG